MHLSVLSMGITDCSTHWSVLIRFDRCLLQPFLLWQMQIPLISQSSLLIGVHLFDSDVACTMSREHIENEPVALSYHGIQSHGHCRRLHVSPVLTQKPTAYLLFAKVLL